MTKENKITIQVSDDTLSRLQRLNGNGDATAAVTEMVESITNSSIGRPFVARPSQFSGKITGPSENVRFN